MNQMLHKVLMADLFWFYCDAQNGEFVYCKNGVDIVRIKKDTTGPFYEWALALLNRL